MGWQREMVSLLPLQHRSPEGKVAEMQPSQGISHSVVPEPPASVLSGIPD